MFCLFKLFHRVRDKLQVIPKLLGNLQSQYSDLYYYFVAKRKLEKKILLVDDCFVLFCCSCLILRYIISLEYIFLTAATNCFEKQQP